MKVVWPPRTLILKFIGRQKKNRTKRNPELFDFLSTCCIRQLEIYSDIPGRGIKFTVYNHLSYLVKQFKVPSSNVRAPPVRESMQEHTGNY